MSTQRKPMGAGKRLLLILVSIVILFQLIQPSQENPAFDKKDEIKVPNEIMAILKRSCWDCHSNETVWPWYSKIAPFSWTISRHVNNGRLYINFSTWEKYTPEQKDKKLEELYKSMHSAMPLQSYVKFHPEAAVTQEERNLIRNWTGKAPY